MTYVPFPFRKDETRRVLAVVCLPHSFIRLGVGSRGENGTQTDRQTDRLGDEMGGVALGVVGVVGEEDGDGNGNGNWVVVGEVRWRCMAR